MLGGLFTGMGADISGSPCWCGADELNRQLAEQETQTR
jgi:hypothetical protein